jgi:serine/threonine-protein kinase RsbT
MGPALDPWTRENSARHSAPASLEDHVDIVNDDDVIAARRQGRMLAAETGFSRTEQSMLAAVITELACNIVDYAGRGELRVCAIENGGRRGVAVIASDHGPGIPNIKGALHASYSVAGGLGLGLKGVAGLMDSLDVISIPGKGTTVTARKWLS